MTFQQPDTHPARYGIIGAEVDHEDIYNGEWFTWGEAYYAWRWDDELDLWRLRCIQYGNEKLTEADHPRIRGRTLYRVEFPDETADAIADKARRHAVNYGAGDAKISIVGEPDPAPEKPIRCGIIGAEVHREDIPNGEWFTWGSADIACRWDAAQRAWRRRRVASGAPLSSRCKPRFDGARLYRVEFPDEATSPAPEEAPDEAPSADVVERPAHYARFKIEPLTFIMENDLSFEVGSTVKYVVRAGHKIYDGMTALESKLTDLKKARRMIDMQIGKLTGNPVY